MEKAAGSRVMIISWLIVKNVSSGTWKVITPKRSPMVSTGTPSIEVSRVTRTREAKTAGIFLVSFGRRRMMAMVASPTVSDQGSVR